MQIIFVAYGLDYVAMALNAVRSLRATNEDVSSVLVTNLAGAHELLRANFDVVVHEDRPDADNRLAKFGAIDHATEDEVALLDVDLEILGDLRPMFSLLRHADLLIHPVRLPTKFDFLLAEGLKGAHLTQFIGYLLVFRRNEQVQRLFHAWEQRFIESGIRRDQPALQRAILDCPDMKLLPLNMIWGTTPEEAAMYADGLARREPIRILHYGSPQLDAGVLSRVGQAHDEIVAALPAAQRDSQEVQEAVERYRMLRHPAMRSRLLRPFAEAYWRGRRTGDGPRILVGKVDAAAGSTHLGGRRLWDDDATP